MSFLSCHFETCLALLNSSCFFLAKKLEFQWSNLEFSFITSQAAWVYWAATNMWWVSKFSFILYKNENRKQKTDFKTCICKQKIKKIKVSLWILDHFMKWNRHSAYLIQYNCQLHILETVLELNFYKRNLKLEMKWLDKHFNKYRETIKIKFCLKREIEIIRLF